MDNEMKNFDDEMVEKLHRKRPKVLLPASTSTNLIYEVNSLTEDTIKSIKSLNSRQHLIIDMVKAIRVSGATLKFVGIVVQGIVFYLVMMIKQ